MHPLYHNRRYLIPFRATLLPQIFCDVLVIGGGVAGLRAAIETASHPDGGEVILAGKGQWELSNTTWAQGGIASVMAEPDTFESHIEDTLRAGAGLCDEPMVRRVVEAGPEAIRRLMEWGMPLDVHGDSPALGREGGHTHPRIVHHDGDATGRALGNTLLQKARENPHVRLFDECFVLDLITTDSNGETGQCLGAITHHPKYGLQVIWAQATVLATGGCGQVFRESTNPNVATGDGLAMAYRAGAELADMAFVQFHPTTLYVAGASRALITEAVRGEGAHLVDRNGTRFMPEYDQRAELAPRDVVARSILQQMAKTGHSHVYLDVRHLGGDAFAERFPAIARLLQQFDIDPGQQMIPVHPSAHYMIGGVRVDAEGRTTVPGLYACGEVASTGLHGANRLASNSLLEGLVFGEATGRACREMITATPPGPIRIISDIPLSDRSDMDLGDVRSSLRSVMWRHVGVLRSGGRLEEVEEMFDFWARYSLDKIFDERLGWEVQNLLTVGALITRAAKWRAESRGVHSREDCPMPVEDFRVHDVWRRGQSEPTTRELAEASPASS
ncbi:MAG: L-aspartate oxidase [Phycisphaeraceae bacterium]